MNKEIRDIESHIVAEGDAELNNLKAALEKEEGVVSSKKEESKTLLKLLDVVNTMVDMAERFDDKKRQVKDRKEELQVSYFPRSTKLFIILRLADVVSSSYSAIESDIRAMIQEI